MIYVDASVLLAYLLTEKRRPPDAFWAEPLASSRLLEYEAWTRFHRSTADAELAEALGELLQQVAFLELGRPVLARALEPFPVGLRTLDALHLASADFLRSRDQDVRFATYDRRMATAARALEFELHPL